MMCRKRYIGNEQLQVIIGQIFRTYSSSEEKVKKKRTLTIITIGIYYLFDRIYYFIKAFLHLLENQNNYVH